MTVMYSQQSVTEKLLEVLEWLKTEELERKEIYIVSDMTDRSWPEFGLLSEKVKQLNGLNVFVIDVGVNEPANYSIGPITLSATQLSRKSTLNIETDVTRLGPASQRNIVLKVEKPDLTKPERKNGKIELPKQHFEVQKSITFSADQTQLVSFQLSNLPIGVHQGWIEIQGKDPLEVDNRRHFTVEVQQNWKVLVVVPDENVIVDNVTQVIAPEQFQESGQNLFDCKTIKQSQLAREELEAFDSVYLLDPKRMNDGLWNDLESMFVKEVGCCWLQAQISLQNPESMKRS